VDTFHITPLTTDEVSRNPTYRGGFAHRISRAKSHEGSEASRKCDRVAACGFNVSRLITIGGDDTAYSAMKLEETAAGRLQIVHVPRRSTTISTCRRMWTRSVSRPHAPLRR